MIQIGLSWKLNQNRFCQFHYLLLCVSCQNGWSSLMAASQNGHVEVVDKLLQHGTTVDLQDKVYKTLFRVNVSDHM